MKLEQIHIEKLFGKFDYTIDLNTEEGITILTGPNGYGKTTILNIIYDIFNDEDTQKGLYLEVVCRFSDGKALTTNKHEARDFKNKLPVFLIADQRIGESNFIKQSVRGIRTSTMLIKTNKSKDLKNKKREIIDKYSDELVEMFVGIEKFARKFSDDLAASYAERLMKRRQQLSSSEFEQRFEILARKYKRLIDYGIYQSELIKSGYEGENQRALSVYLEDWEKNVAIYDSFIAMLDLFRKLVNKKNFSNKTMNIKYEEGISFITNDGEKLDLNKLSPGEQNEIIMLFDIIFILEQDMLVLIDEPETSLHVSWQHDFLRDLREIQKVNPLNFLIATHSPSIINENWELVQDLYDKAENAEDKTNE